MTAVLLLSMMKADGENDNIMVKGRARLKFFWGVSEPV